MTIGEKPKSTAEAALIGRISMSPELDTLDQLLGGEQSLAVIRCLYPDDQHFAQAVHALLLNQDVRLLAHDGTEIPQWRWRELFIDGRVIPEMQRFRLDITDRGARRIA